MESDEDKAMPTLQGFLEMRENPVAYGFLCNRFIPSIVGSYKWKTNFHVERLSTFVTVTDEALTLLFWKIVGIDGETWRNLEMRRRAASLLCICSAERAMAPENIRDGVKRGWNV